jgi:stearoyl-CoA desaturase (Delta-9 desaturase)
MRKKDWVNISFLSLTPVIGVAGTAAYALFFGVRWWEPVLLFVLFSLVSFSVTAGYHRCFAHKSYESHPLLQAFYLFFGAMALQNSTLKWAADHRDHHRYVDKEWDPYSIRRGGLWAHILWLFYKEPSERSYENVPDLQANRLIQLQYRWCHAIGIVAGLGIPTAIGALFGRPLGGLLWGGFLRIALIHHTTFLVNSVAHLYGSRPYTEENSARDNGLLAFITNGEGYHNFHHRFPADFRNGIRWYQWDPSKWWIRGLSSLGLARSLRRTPTLVIERSRLETALGRAEKCLPQAPAHLSDAIRQSLEAAQHSLERAAALWNELQQKRRKDWREYREHLSRAREHWREALRMLAQVPEEA